MVHEFIHQCLDILCSIQNFPQYAHHLILYPRTLLLFYFTPLCSSGSLCLPFSSFPCLTIGPAHTSRFESLPSFFPLKNSSIDPINLFYISITEFASVFFAIYTPLPLNRLQFQRTETYSTLCFILASWRLSTACLDGCF